MRKVFRNALIIALSGAMLGGLYSCKDTDEDLRNELETEFTKQLNALRDSQTSLESALQAQIDALKTRMGTAEGDITTLKGQVSTLESELEKLKNAVAQINSCDCDTNKVKALYDAIANLEAAIGDAAAGTGLNGQIKALQDAIAALDSTKGSAEDIARLDSMIVELQTAIAQCAGKSELANYATLAALNETNTQLQTVADSLKSLQSDFSALRAGLSDQIQTAIDKALENYATVQALADSTAAVRDEANKNLETAKELLRQEIATAIENLKGNYNGTLGDLNDAFQAADQKLQDQIDELKKQVDTNTTAIKAIENKLAKLVTSVIVQGTYNPAFGTIALPLNVRSNVLCAYVGETENAVEFPSTKTLNLVNAEQAFTKADFEILGSVKSVKLEDGETIVDDAEGNAGKIYVTVNPTSVDFTGLEFKLVNSLDEESGITLSAPVPSTDKLTFGFSATRGEASNGFYEMKANVDAEKVNSVRLTLDSSLKSALKDLYKNKTNANFTNLALTIYKQFDGILDANALKASWTNDDNTTNSVYSQYNVAAFSFKPLSYAFDPSLSYTFSYIPDVPSLDSFTFDLNIKVPEFNIDINLDNIDFNIDTNFTFDASSLSGTTVNVEIEIPAFDYNSDLGMYIVKTDSNNNIVYEKKTITVDLADFVNSLSISLGDAISSQLQNVVTSMTDQIKSVIKDQLVAQIQKQLATSVTGTIQDMIDNLKGEINSQIGSFTSQFSSYLTKLQTLVNRMNSIIERLNNGININNFLQPTLVYTTGNGSYSLVSGVKTSPTLLKLDGGNAIILQPTSLSGELIAPAYKKFIGITNVISNSDSSKTAQGGDADCKAAASKANSQSYIDEVISGTRYGVPFVGESGYTYEIAYAALDYNGKCAVSRFYIKVL